MATIVQGNGVSNAATGQTSFSDAYDTTPTSGNLLVAVFGARDSNSDAEPAYTVSTGWTVIGLSNPMEFHNVGIAWRTADGSADDAGIEVTSTTGDLRSTWVGLIEINESGVSDWTVDASSFNGSGATNVSSIASGSTGTLSSSTGAAVIVGTSRTGSEDLSTDTGTSLAGTDAIFETDAGSANFIAAWLDLAATAALDATISEASGASRMGAGIAVFVEDAGGAIDLIVADLTVASSIDAPTLTQVHELAVSDLTVASSIEVPALTQVHELAVADLAVGSSIDTPTLTQTHQLVVSDLTVASTVEAPTLTQVHQLAVADLTVASTLDAPTLTQTHNLTVSDLTVATTIDTPTLTVGGVDLVVADLTVATTIDSPTLAQVHELVVADLTVSTTIDVPALTQVHELTVADLAVAVTIDTVTLTFGITSTVIKIVSARPANRVLDARRANRVVAARPANRVLEAR